MCSNFNKVHIFLSNVQEVKICVEFNKYSWILKFANEFYQEFKKYSLTKRMFMVSKSIQKIKYVP